jgi:hypothetical protein
MKTQFEKSLGNPVDFLKNLKAYAAQFSELSGFKYYDLTKIREFVKSCNYEISSDPSVFRPIVAAFGVVIIDYYAQRLRYRGFIKRRIMVESKGFNCEFLDLFYRCIFEDFNLADEGDALPTKL